MKKNRNKILAIFMTVFTLIILIGITYTFFSASVSNTNNEKLTTQTATMSLEFDDNDNGVSANLNLNESIVKKFTLENTGTVDAYAKIKWYDLVNTYTPDSLSWTLEQSETENGRYILVGSGKVPVSSNSSNKLLKGSLLVPTNRTYYYKLTITLNDLEVNQSSDINASMHSKFSLSTESDTAVDTVQKLVAGNSINDVSTIYSSESEYELQEKYVLNFNGFILSTAHEYDTNNFESCKGDLIYYLSEFGSTIDGECKVNPSTGKYNIYMTGNGSLIFTNQEQCENTKSDWEFENMTCVNTEVKVPINSLSECTNTLAYDGTEDNNLRYVGLNPCNYVTFNGEAPTEAKVYRIINRETGDNIDGNGISFTSLAECNEAIENNYLWNINNKSECQEKIEVINGWRIVGIMNNVDDGTGNLESRIKLVRANSLGDYSWDTSPLSINGGNGVNDWAQADLKNELNGDYLNTSLSANTSWYSKYQGQNIFKSYDYTKGLKQQTQSLIGNAKWYLGGITISNPPSLIYFIEREKSSWPGPEQTCNDGACPRATEWTGKVALIYPSDYGLATAGGQTVSRFSCINFLSSFWGYDGTWMNNNYKDCRLNNWIPPQWSLSPETYSPIAAIVTGYSFYGDDGYCVSEAFPVHPATYLKSDVSFSGGSGTPDDPYILS